MAVRVSVSLLSSTRRKTGDRAVPSFRILTVLHLHSLRPPLNGQAFAGCLHKVVLPLPVEGIADAVKRYKVGVAKHHT